MSLLNEVVQDIHKTQYLPWIDNPDHGIDAKDFWNYIDRSSIFYYMKRYYFRNPYYMYKDINKDILLVDKASSMNMKYTMSSYFQIFEYDGDSNIYLHDWVLCSDILVPKIYRELIESYDESETFNENLKRLELSIPDDLFILLLKGRILTITH